MSDQPPEHVHLSPEEAVRVAAACDRFEQAWKAVPSDGSRPRLASYLGLCDGPARVVLARELLARERACRERYDRSAPPGNDPKDDAPDEIPEDVETFLGLRAGPRNQAADLPCIPGLELLNVLGYGGMGVVFQARQAALGRDVAVKLLRQAHPDGSAHRERFLQEARAVARLQHPHIVQVYDFGELPGAGGATSQPYLVMEYVAGGSLADLLRGPPLPPAEAARLVEALAEAIHYAHQQGVVHRDLKPGNVLIVDRGSWIVNREDNPNAPRTTNHEPRTTPKITDFGLAKLLSESALTHTGDVIGTPGYMAPEQASGHPDGVTAAVDVYGLGAILYEALTGRPPFLAATTEATLLQVKLEDPVPPRRLQPTVPRDLNTICLKCLRKEAGRRYASAQELADDLRRFRSGEPIRARPVGAGERVVRWCRRQPALASALTATVLIFLAGLSGILWQWRSARHHAAEADRNAADFRQERDTALREHARAELHLREARKRVDRLTQVGQELLQRPRLHKLGREVMEDALSYYEVILPREGSDPRLRLEAARLYRQVAQIHHTLGRWARAIDAYSQQGRLLAGLLKAEPANQALAHDLALSHRWRGNALRDLGRAREAREAYGQAAELHERLLCGSPGDPGCQVALANTLINLASLLSPREETETLKGLHERILELNQAAVDAAPDKASFQTELALALENRGLFFLNTGQVAAATDALRGALTIRQDLRACGRLGRSQERYLGRNYAYLGRALAAARQSPAAEQAYQEAVQVLDPLVTDFPDSPYHRMNLAEVQGDLADLQKDTGRPDKAEESRRQAIRHYEILTADFGEDPGNRQNLVRSHLLLGNLLCETGRCVEGGGQYRLALKVDPTSAAAQNELAWFLATAAEPGLRDAAEAVQLAQQAVAAAPKDGNYRNTLGVARYYHGEINEAVAVLEEAMRLRAGGDSYDWFYLAMAHRRLGHSDKAGTWFDRAVQWMDKHQPRNSELRRFRAEAEALMAGMDKP
jgi:serine/threonine-protein kinase